MYKSKSQLPFIDLDNKKDSGPLYRQIYTAIRTAILNGEFAPKFQLPSTRLLAQDLGVSRITVVNAYEQLFAEGYLEATTGAGTFVASELPEDLLQTDLTKKEKARQEQADLPLRLSKYGANLVADESPAPGDEARTVFLPFQNGLTAIDEFPFEVWSKIAAKFYKDPPGHLLGYGEHQGLKQLREAIASHLRSSRCVICRADQIIITSGAQQALDLTTRIFLSPEDAVVVEDPCYPEVRDLCAAASAKIVSVIVDKEGFNADKIPTAGNGAKLAYVTPSHQYPLGVTMTIARRLALLEWAKQNNSFIIEDDYNSEFRYAGRPLASLQGLDTSGRVIYIGTFSKTIFPALRIGCVVVPDELIEHFIKAKALADVHSPPVEQAILAEFIAEGHYGRHLRRMRKLYENRQRILVEECEKHLNGLLRIEKAEAGMHLVGWLAEGFDDKVVADEASKDGLKIMPISHYFESGVPKAGLILGYTAFDERQIRSGIKKLERVLKRLKS